MKQNEFHHCPNPWCGSSEIEVAHVLPSAFTRDDAFWCKCIQCGIAGPSRTNRAAAVSAWNEVPSGASPEIDAIRGALADAISRLVLIEEAARESKAEWPGTMFANRMLWIETEARVGAEIARSAFGNPTDTDGGYA